MISKDIATIPRQVVSDYGGVTYLLAADGTPIASRHGVTVERLPPGFTMPSRIKSSRTLWPVGVDPRQDPDLSWSVAQALKEFDLI